MLMEEVHVDLQPSLDRIQLVAGLLGATGEIVLDDGEDIDRTSCGRLPILKAAELSYHQNIFDLSESRRICDSRVSLICAFPCFACRTLDG